MPQSTSVLQPVLDPVGAGRIGPVRTARAASGGWAWQHRPPAQLPGAQLPLWQSAPSLQRWPVAQGAQLSPPQSTSVSSPFFTPSSQVGSPASVTFRVRVVVVVEVVVAVVVV